MRWDAFFYALLPIVTTRDKIFLPESKSFIKGWTLLAEKLRSLGIKGKLEVREEFRSGGSTSKSHSHVKAVRRKKAATNGVWLDVGDCGPKENMGFLKHSLVGRPPLTLFRRHQRWKFGRGKFGG